MNCRAVSQASRIYHWPFMTKHLRALWCPLQYSFPPHASYPQVFYLLAALPKVVG